MPAINKIDYLNREALTSVFFGYLETKKTQLCPGSLAELQKKFIDNFEQVEVITDEEVIQFLNQENIPRSLMRQWQDKLKASLEEILKNYLNWIPGEKQLELAQKFFDKDITISQILEQDPNLLEYVNNDIRNLQTSK